MVFVDGFCRRPVRRAVESTLGVSAVAAISRAGGSAVPCTAQRFFGTNCLPSAPGRDHRLRRMLGASITRPCFQFRLPRRPAKQPGPCSTQTGGRGRSGPGINGDRGDAPRRAGPRVSTRRVIPTAHRAGGPVGLRPRTRRSTSRSEPTLRRETAQRKGSRGAPVWEASLSHGFFRMCRPVQPCVLSVWMQIGFAQVLASPRCIPPCFWRSAWRF